MCAALTNLSNGAPTRPNRIPFFKKNEKETKDERNQSTTKSFSTHLNATFHLSFSLSDLEMSTSSPVFTVFLCAHYAHNIRGLSKLLQVSQSCKQATWKVFCNSISKSVGSLHCTTFAQISLWFVRLSCKNTKLIHQLSLAKYYRSSSKSKSNFNIF